MKLMILILLVVLAGCATSGPPKTIAEGANGDVDYDACLVIGQSNLICLRLKARRSGVKDVE